MMEKKNLRWDREEEALLVIVIIIENPICLTRIHQAFEVIDLFQTLQPNKEVWCEQIVNIIIQ